MLDKMLFIRKMIELKMLYPKWELDIENETICGVWYNKFKHLSNDVFKDTMNKYSSTIKYPPMSPANILELECTEERTYLIEEKIDYNKYIINVKNFILKFGLNPFSEIMINSVFILFKKEPQNLDLKIVQEFSDIFKNKVIEIESLENKIKEIRINQILIELKEN